MKKILSILGLVAALSVPSYAAIVSTVTTTTGGKASLLLQPYESLRYTITDSTGVAEGTVKLEKSRDGVNFTPTTVSQTTDVAGSTVTGVFYNEGQRAYFRWNITAYTGGTYNLKLEDVDDDVQIFKNNKSVDVLEIYDDSIRSKSYPIKKVTNVSEPTAGDTLEIDVLGGFNVFSTSATLSGIPSISTENVVAGTILTFTTSSATLTFQDNDTLSGSALELGGTERGLGIGDILEIIYRDSKWWEIGFYNN